MRISENFGRDGTELGDTIWVVLSCRKRQNFDLPFGFDDVRWIHETFHNHLRS
jgi:hypothetical protein